MIIKVCGMRETENIHALYDSGIRAMGFIFFEKSKRYFETGEHKPNLVDLPDDLIKIGVFVNEEEDIVIDTICENGLSFAQLHGEETPEYCSRVRKYAKVLKAFSVDENFNFETTQDYLGCDYLLFDAKGAEYGGNGIQYNWEILKRYTYDTPFLLSGGIGPDDVEKISEVKHPRLAGIDINSGFEDRPGLKNVEKINSFIKNLSCSNTQ